MVLAFPPPSILVGGKEQLGNYMEPSFACITQLKTKERLSKARCVSLQEKEKKKTRCPLRSSRIVLLVSIKQQGVGGRLSAASRRLSLNMQDFRF